MIEKTVLCMNKRGFHRMAYTEWGPRDAERTVVCVHGLTRNGRDFDLLAEAMAGAGWRVVCPDVVGRGRSEWLADARGYGQPQYMSDLTTLIARLDVAAVDWVGTSMGGIAGMLLAAMPGTPIRRLVVNDVGPFIPKAALERIAGYVGGDPRFDGIAELESHLRRVQSGFGDLTDAQWRHMAEHSARPVEDGKLALAYDPAIAAGFTPGAMEDLDIWGAWDRIEGPVLALRGAESDLLLRETAAEMAARGPKATMVEIDRCGHAPALMDAAQIATVRGWLAEHR
ncbi:MAG: alpha/beta fold hydrolase [Alphaproteobacteria bacterium]